MTDCRYYDMCGLIDVLPQQECPVAECCRHFAPMPDVEELLKLASRMESDANEAIYFEMTMEPFDIAEYAAKIREAVGA